MFTTPPAQSTSSTGGDAQTPTEGSGGTPATTSNTTANGIIIETFADTPPSVDSRQVVPPTLTSDVQLPAAVPPSPNAVVNTTTSSVPPQTHLLNNSSDLVSSPVLDSQPTDALRLITETPLDTSPVTPSTPCLVPPVLSLGPSRTTAPRVISPIAHQPPTVSTLPQVRPADRSISIPGSMDGAVSSGAGTPVPAEKSHYKVRNPTNGTTIAQSRRDSIEGAPGIILTLGARGYVLSGKPDVPTAPPFTSSSTGPPTPAPSDEPVVPPPQHSLEDSELTTSADSDGVTAASFHRFIFAPRDIPDYDIDRSDFPSWFHEHGRLDSILSVEAGELWEKLITTWLRQERRLCFGLDRHIVS